jgi:hypothetical protein
MILMIQSVLSVYNRILTLKRMILRCQCGHPTLDELQEPVVEEERIGHILNQVVLMTSLELLLLSVQEHKFNEPYSVPVLGVHELQDDLSHKSHGYVFHSLPTDVPVDIHMLTV